MEVAEDLIIEDVPVCEQPQELLIKRLQIPGAVTSDKDFAALYQDLDKHAAALDLMEVDEPRPSTTIVEECNQRMEWLVLHVMEARVRTTMSNLYKLSMVC